jgi:hypothetical protein
MRKEGDLWSVPGPHLENYNVLSQRIRLGRDYLFHGTPVCASGSVNAVSELESLRDVHEL